MRRTSEPLNVTFGFLHVANTLDLNEKSQRFFGPGSYAYNAVLDGVRKQNVHPKFVPTTMEASSGSCNELFNCTGQLRTFKNENWDVSLMAQSLSILRFTGSNSPFLIGPTKFESSLHILSGVEQSQSVDAPNVQVTDSFNKLGVELVSLYVIWVLIAYLLSVFFRKIIYSQLRTTKRKRFRKDKLIWKFIAGILNQFQTSPDHNSLRVLWYAFLISVFMFVEFYNGLFSTELTVKDEPYKIEDLEGVVSSSAYPVFTNADSGSASIFEKSQNPLMKSVYEKYKANDESEFKRFVEASSVTLLKYLNLLKELKAIVIGQRALTTMYIRFDCAVKDEQNYDHANEELHVARNTYHPVINSWLYNRNVNYEVRERITSTFRAAVETGLFDFMYKSQFPQEALESAGIFLKGGGRSQMCLYGDKKFENHPRPMLVGDMVTLFRGFSGALSIAIVWLAFEMLQKLQFRF